MVVPNPSYLLRHLPEQQPSGSPAAAASRGQRCTTRQSMPAQTCCTHQEEGLEEEIVHVRLGIDALDPQA